MSKYKICLVPTCPNTRKNSPNKTFIYVPDDLKSRWCTENNFEYVPKQHFCCEDHLDLKEDLSNYRPWKLMNAKPILKSSANLFLELTKDKETTGVLSTTEMENWLNPESTNLISARSNHTFVISPMRSKNAISIDIQCKTETEDRGTYSQITFEQSDRPLSSEVKADASLQCALVAADDTVKPRKSRFFQSTPKRYDLVQDNRNLINRSWIAKNAYNKTVPSVPGTLVPTYQSTSATQKSRYSRPAATKTDNPQQYQGKAPRTVETPRTTNYLQSRSQFRSIETFRKPETPIEKKTRPSTSKAPPAHPFRAIVCETSKNRSTRSNVSHDPGTQVRIRRPSKNTAHVSSQVGSRKSLDRYSVSGSKTKEKLSPSPSNRSRASYPKPCSNQIVIYIPKSSNHDSYYVGKPFIYSKETEVI